VDHGEPTVDGGEAVQDGSGVVLRAVIDGDDLNVWVVLREERTDTSLDVSAFIARRQDD
jgi:hypothetical protein